MEEQHSDERLFVERHTLIKFLLYENDDEHLL